MSWAVRTLSTYISTWLMPLVSVAVAVMVTVPVRPVAPLAGVSDRVGGVVSAGGEIVQV